MKKEKLCSTITEFDYIRIILKNYSDFLFLYLSQSSRNMDVAYEGVPSSWSHRLTKALAHH